MLNEEHLISRLSNKELIHKNKYCKTKAKDLINELKALVITSDRVKAELKLRLIDLQIESEIAENWRINSDDPFLDVLLDLH